MSDSDADLSPLQRRILGLLSDVEGWTLTGGAALTLRAHHRETRDLDLFWYGTQTITRLAEAVRDRLRTVDELQLETIQTSPRFANEEGTARARAVNEHRRHPGRAHPSKKKPT